MKRRTAVKATPISLDLCDGNSMQLSLETQQKLVLSPFFLCF